MAFKPKLYNHTLLPAEHWEFLSVFRSRAKWAEYLPYMIAARNKINLYQASLSKWDDPVL